MMYHDNDQLPEESQAADLITDLKDLYTLNAADAQSLARIRKRFHQHSSASQEVQHTPLHPLIQAPIPTSSGKGIQMHQHLIAEQKTISWHQRINKFTAVLVTIMVVGALIVTFTLIHHSSTGSQQATTGSSWNARPFPSQVKLVNKTTAWVTTNVPIPGKGDVNGPLLRTADGGKTWQDVTPSHLNFAIPPTLETLNDGITAWALEEPQTIDGSAHLLRTLDGGKSWLEFIIPQVGFINSMTFTDQNHGWFLCTKATDESKTLFSTINGGQTWQQNVQAPLQNTNLSTSQSTIMQFADQQTGWLQIPLQAEKSQLYVTHDAGSSWSLLTTPAEVSSPVFTFVDTQYGYLVDTSKLAKKFLTFYTTSDGGKSWQGSTSIQLSNAIDQETFLTNHQILIISGHKVIVYTFSNGQWIRSSEHTGASANLLANSFVSSTTGIASVDYSRPDTSDFGSFNQDHMGLIKTTDGGASWSQVKLTIPTKKVTSYTMAYLTNSGWTYYTAHEGTGTSTFTQKDQSQPDNLYPAPLPNLQAKKWLVRFMCSTSVSTAELAFNGQQFSTPNCNQQPISKVVTFASPQSFQTLRVTIQGHDFWLVAIEACTNEQICQADSN
jgi:photosystem II stability/assembly factor-like uncharacterized protein